MKPFRLIRLIRNEVDITITSCVTMYNNPLLPSQYYHIYNHAIGDECLFRQPANYLYFLERYGHYMFPLVRTYAYCLMPNHFHLLIQIREEAELMAHFQHIKRTQLPQSVTVNYAEFVMQQFSNFFNSYAKSFNRRFDRKGALFLNYVRRKPVELEKYFTALVAYIHRNPAHHGFCRQAAQWPYSSLHSIASNKRTRLERSAVLDWFGGIEPYLVFHQQENFAPHEDWEFGY